MSCAADRGGVRCSGLARPDAGVSQFTRLFVYVAALVLDRHADLLVRAYPLLV